MNVDCSEGGDKAFYNPSCDRITLPEMNKFETEYDYMATLLHEAGHATGHISRLNRDMTGVFGSPEYAKEELRAEIALMFWKTSQMNCLQPLRMQKKFQII